MTWNAVWPVMAFFLGAVITRWNDARRESVAARLAREERFEALQRASWVQLQDLLGELWQTATEAGALKSRRSEQLKAWSASKQAPEAEPMPPPDPDLVAKASAYFLARQRAMAVGSRLADDHARTLADQAVAKAHSYQSIARMDQRPLSLDEWAEANSSMDAAVGYLGELIRRPAERPLATSTLVGRLRRLQNGPIERQA